MTLPTLNLYKTFFQILKIGNTYIQTKKIFTTKHKFNYLRQPLDNYHY